MLRFASLLVFLCLFGCSDSSDDDSGTSNDTIQDQANGCGIDDGSYSATVDYDNPETGYTATYILDVQVENCEVTEIDFPNGGWLDNDHIYPSELDSDGNATVEDDRGRTFDVHVEK
jgi:hypothetical protein